MGNARNFFSKAQQQTLLEAIRTAETNTSGEIRIHMDDKCREDVLDRAAYVFEMLEMHKTELRNGILFYLAYEDHKFAVIGDLGIHAKVEEHFWEGIRDRLVEEFREGRFAEGLVAGIEEAGTKLKVHFPYQQDDVNELPDDLSFGDKA